MILQSLAGLPAFLLYFCTGLIAVVLYLFVYTRVTPHDEFKLICDNDPAAAIALGLSLLGFVIPVVSAIMHTANVIDCLIWSVIALIVQIAVYYIAKIPVPNLSARIANGELAPAIWLVWRRWPRARSTRHRWSTDHGRTSSRTVRKAAATAARTLVAGEALRARRTAGDGHARGGRRSLCADAARQLRPQPPRRRGVRHTGPDQHGVQLALVIEWRALVRIVVAQQFLW